MAHDRAQVNVLGVAASPALMIPAGKEGPDLGAVLKKAASRALPSGAAGGVAMGLNILCLMWMRTTVNYQYRYGSGTVTAIKALYKEGGSTPAGITRFYRGLVPALFQGPLSRFGEHLAPLIRAEPRSHCAAPRFAPACAAGRFDRLAHRVCKAHRCVSASSLGRDHVRRAGMSCVWEF